MTDINGLLTTTRQEGSLSDHQKNYAKEVAPMKNLQEIVEKVKPNVSQNTRTNISIFS